MSNEHQIFHDRIQAWLSGQLNPEATVEFERHRAHCRQCSAFADAEKQFWDLLGEGKIQNEGPVPSVWPKVQQEISGFGNHHSLPTNGWFFGGGKLVRSSLAACVVLVGLAVGVLAPGVSVQANTENVSSDVWVSEASWLDVSTTDGLAGVWLEPGLSGESDGS